MSVQSEQSISWHSTRIFVWKLKILQYHLFHEINVNIPTKPKSVKAVPAYQFVHKKINIILPAEWKNNSLKSKKGGIPNVNWPTFPPSRIYEY